MMQQTTLRQEFKRKRAQQARWRRIATGMAVAGILAVGVAGTFVYKFNTSDATIAEGNKAFTAQEYDAALEKYQAAQVTAPIFGEPFYNAANALYKKGAFDQAQPLLEQALTRSNDKIAEFIQYNLGNVSYSAKQFEQAIAHYEDALHVDPDDKDAKYNLELALLQKQQQDQQQQQNQQDQQQNQDQRNQQNQDQQNQDQQNQDQQDQQNQDQQNQDQNGQQQNQDQQNQQQQNQQGGQDQKQQDQQGGQSSQDQKDQKQNGQQQNGQDQNGQPQQDQQEQQQNAQAQNGQQPQQNQQQQGQQGQQPQDAQDQTGQPQQGSGVAPGQPTDQQGNEQGYAYKPGELTQEQAQQLLAAVGGNSQTLMEKLQMYLYSPEDQPEKDW
jgi:Tetratricopeptide repeat